jgi:flagellar protein FlaG
LWQGNFICLTAARKGFIMIEMQGGPRVTIPSAAPPARAGAGVPAQGAPAPEITRPKIVPIERPQIKVDTEGDKKRLDQAIARMNERMQDGGRGLAFQVDPSLNRPVVTVTNQETGEVIRQIPNEVIIRMARSIDETKGNLLNAKV